MLERARVTPAASTQHQAEESVGEAATTAVNLLDLEDEQQAGAADLLTGHPPGSVGA
jgi:hypothetical protein